MTKMSNDLYYTCALIEYIGRITKNQRAVIVDALGAKYLKHILNHADVFHCEQIAEVAERFIDACHIEEGEFDNIATCKYDVPSYWDIGAVYARLIENVAKRDLVDEIVEVYHSWIASYIDNYNIAVYYMTPQYLQLSYEEGSLLE
ncbi:MAG: hypothetical protein ACRCW2_15325 [Cellulosilyticaceae bacterium]